MLQLRCWNHAIQDLKLGAKKHFNIKEEVNAVQDIVVQDVVAQANKKETLANAIDTITNLLRATSRTDFFIDRNSIQQETLTNTARATLLLGQDLVQYHANTKVFTVRSLDHHLVHVVHMNDPKRLFRCSCPSTLQNCSHVLAVKLFLGILADKCNNKINLGHERKRKRIDDKITKPGGKRPRRIDKESNKKYTSPYFSASQINTTNDSQTCQGDITSSRVNTSINSPPVIRALTGVSNLPSSSTSTVDVAPKLVRVIRFLTPINVTVPLPQSNQYVAYIP
ncbi:unnamed protein product [Rotaria sp. Silwood2]|nr:unnamed protein product [Rotaria sp. Silwood2]CAF2999898.1 unnamed protein product [Rotaria sp. Silwood2]CAF3161585.1 unnamed protein product [Rotaria sp. Silwood2]CAF4208854.1 unnamed protein product [Rotaria sp. Silwood2]CAF4212566.1 unnamed protein product [Rotaria sp. Silwood2]